MRLVLAVAVALLVSSTAFAQSDAGDDDAGSAFDAGLIALDAGPGFDGSYPDGSVGIGGADQNQQEADDTTGRVPGFCRRNIECPQAFQCLDNHCKYTGIRKADGGFGCGGMATAGALPLGVLAAFLRRLRRR